MNPNIWWLNFILGNIILLILLHYILSIRIQLSQESHMLGKRLDIYKLSLDFIIII